MLKAPFPWFGGKSRVAHLVWDRFGDTVNYVEPFAGSLAVLLGRPWGPGKNETVNDKDCYLANFWRSLQRDPQGVADAANWPVNEADLHARHRWLVSQSEFRNRMLTDPDFFDCKIAGWWVWGLSLWIGSGWCVRPEWISRSGCARAERGVHAKRPQLKKGNNGTHRQGLSEDVWLVRPRLQPQGITRQMPALSGDSGASGRGIHAQYASNLLTYFEALATRLRRVRVCCGDWERILGPSPTTKIGLTAVLLDPPYDLRIARSKQSGSDGAAPSDNIYSEHDNELSHAVRRWAIDNGNDPLLRIALCGYEGEHAMPETWQCIAWKANGGYGNQGTNTRGRENAHRERIWFSPHCLRPQQSLFANAKELAC